MNLSIAAELTTIFRVDFLIDIIHIYLTPVGKLRPRGFKLLPWDHSVRRGQSRVKSLCNFMLFFGKA